MATADATMTEERRTFLRRALDAAQIAGSKTLAVAKKAGGWIKRQATNLIKAKPVRWLWSKVQPAASKVWSWGAPYRKWTWKVTKKVAKSPFSWLVALLGGILVGSKIVLFFVAAALLLVVALIATIIYYMNKATKANKGEKKPMSERFTDAMRTATEKIADAAEQTADKVDDEVAKARERRAAAEVVKDAEKATEAAAEKLDEAREAETEARIAEARANAGNGRDNEYKVQFPEMEINPDETLAQRHESLEAVYNTEFAKGTAADPYYLSELHGRINLNTVRRGRGGKAHKNASVSDIHKNLRSQTASVRKSDDTEDLKWVAVYRGAVAEDQHNKAVARAKAEKSKSPTT